MTTIAVGCPIRRRHWILPLWRQAIEAEIAATPGLDFVGYKFVAGADDRRDIDLVRSWPDTEVVTVNEPIRADTRDWRRERLAQMVGLRNCLLPLVRNDAPDLFLSADSDILLAPGSLASMLDVLAQVNDDDTNGGRTRDCWAVGGKAFMVGGGISVNEPSFGQRSGLHSFVRGDTDQIIRADIIMGVKLMTPRAYAVDYRFHKSGEDIGWSLAVAEAGGDLFWDGRVASKHITDYQWLYAVDPRVGF